MVRMRWMAESPKGRLKDNMQFILRKVDTEGTVSSFGLEVDVQKSTSLEANVFKLTYDGIGKEGSKE